MVHSFDLDRETAVEAVGDGRWTIPLSARWNIGENPNGGYLMAVMLRALSTLAIGPDPLTLTTHFLRPGLGDVAGQIDGHVVKPGRTMSTVRGAMVQEGKPRLEMLVGFGDLGADPTDAARSISVPPSSLPPPGQCVDRRELAQGVSLPLLDRLDVRVAERYAATGEQGAVEQSRADMSGWIRFADGRPPDAMALPLFADAFPPSVFTRFGNIGWVPTLEMTVQVRRRPVDGWIAAHFECDDLRNGTMIETGSLWDEAGRLVARSRQLGLLLAREGVDG